MTEAELYTLQDKQFYGCMLQLAELLDLGVFCDVTLVAGDGQQVIAHKVVLAARIPFFRARFDSGLFSSDMITLDTIKHSVLRRVTEFSYKGSIQADSWEDVCDILIAADYLQLETLKEQCELVLQEKMSVENCIFLCNLSTTFNFSILKACAIKFAGIHWPRVTEHTSWVLLNQASLQDLLSMDQLNVSNEDSVLSAALSWIKHDSRRQPYLPTVLSEVRVQLLSATSLAALKQEGQFFSDAVSTNSGKEPETKRSNLNKRSYFGNSLYVFLYNESTEESNMEIYSAINDQWKSEYYAPALRDNAVVVVDDIIYVLNQASQFYSGEGRLCSDEIDMDSEFPDFCSYDPSLQKWQQENDGYLADRLELDYSAASSVKEYILWAGGGVAQSIHWDSSPSAHLFNTVSKEWKAVKDMGMGKLHHRMATLHDIVYCVGGMAADANAAENEAYNVVINEWNLIQRMHKYRVDTALVATDSKIMAIGGWDTPNCTPNSTTEWFDPRVGRWQMGVDMPIQSEKMGATVLGNEIYLVGGVYYKYGRPATYLDSYSLQIYILDQRMEKWRTGPELPGPGGKPCYVVSIN